MGTRPDDETGKIFQRQLDIFDPDAYDVQIDVVGAGSTGSWDILNLAKVGFKTFRVFDPDIVEPRNTSGQLYGLEDEGKPKVDALRDIIGRIADTQMTTYHCAWEPSRPLEGIVIMGADSMKVRRQIYEQTMFKPQVKLVVDHRIGGQKAQLFAYVPTDADAVADYETTLFTDEQAEELPCTARGISDVNLFVASMTVRNIRRFLTDGPSALIHEMHYDAETGVVVRRACGKGYV